jgi:hypothetical protein
MNCRDGNVIIAESTKTCQQQNRYDTIYLSEFHRSNVCRKSIIFEILTNYYLQNVLKKRNKKRPNRSLSPVRSV